jgi:hypothetical protein
MMVKNRLVLEVADKSEEAILRTYVGDSVSVKTVAVADVVSALAKELEMSTGILPAGTRFFSGTRQLYSVGVQVPAAARTVRFNLAGTGLATVTVPFPELLFVFKVGNRRLDTGNTSLFACIPPIGKAYDPLYRFPFGNVWESGSDEGKVCWGDIQIPEIDEPVVLDSVVAKFFSSVFTGHLVHGTSMFVPPNSEVVNLQTLLEHLKDKRFFPDGMLKQSGSTLGKAMQDRKARYDL